MLGAERHRGAGARAAVGATERRDVLGEHVTQLRNPAGQAVDLRADEDRHPEMVTCSVHMPRSSAIVRVLALVVVLVALPAGQAHAAPGASSPPPTARASRASRRR